MSAQTPAPVQIGYLDENGHPTVKITVSGPTFPDVGQEFEAMIDTGFSGFLMMPIMSAFPLALTLLGTSNYTLADGSTSPKLLAFGAVALDGEKTSGVIVLEPNSCGLLLGIDFLRRCKRALMVTERGVVLIHNAVLEEIGKIVAAAAEAAEKALQQSQQENLPFEAASQ